MSHSLGISTLSRSWHGWAARRAGQGTSRVGLGVRTPPCRGPVSRIVIRLMPAVLVSLSALATSGQTLSADPPVQRGLGADVTAWARAQVLSSPTGPLDERKLDELTGRPLGVGWDSLVPIEELSGFTLLDRLRREFPRPGDAERVAAELRRLRDEKVFRPTDPTDTRELLWRVAPAAMHDEPRSATDEEAACGMASQRLREAITDCLHRCGVPSLRDDESVRVLQADLLRAGAEFDGLCLGSLVPYRLTTEGALAADALPGFVPASAPRLLWVLLDASTTLSGEGGPVCSALLLPGGMLLTARHCFVDEHGLAIQGLDGRPLLDLGREGKLQLGNVARPEAATSVSLELVGTLGDRPLGAATPPGTANDALLFRASGAPDVPEVTFATAAVGERVWVFGPYSLSDRSRPAGQDGMSSWYQSLRWTRVGACRVLYADENCLKHTCQTIQGYSGAPIIGDRGGEATVLGMQVGSGDAEGCASPGFAAGFNTGIAGVRLGPLVSDAGLPE